jgi:hypothetical protein
VFSWFLKVCAFKCMQLVPASLHHGGGGFGPRGDGGVLPPVVTNLYPPKGHVAGGTRLTIHGAGFRNTPVTVGNTFHASRYFAVKTHPLMAWQPVRAV